MALELWPTMRMPGLPRTWRRLLPEVPTTVKMVISIKHILGSLKSNYLKRILSHCRSLECEAGNVDVPNNDSWMALEPAKVGW